MCLMIKRTGPVQITNMPYATLNDIGVPIGFSDVK